ncbi:hypothetical protein SBA4_1140002 [Candidatus Sulfopaludibacter sp. SbA4]|nr:hypothetical protein SBA4_1140002 [Candidatus Sulfopaludibacter sp. SbA4]
MDVMKGRSEGDSLRCSFCHKEQSVVGKLISSPSDYPRAYICDECIAVCNSIIEDDNPGAFSQWHPLTHQLFKAIRQWVALPQGDEARLAEVRRLAEQILGRARVGAALELPAGAELDRMVESQVLGMAEPAPGEVAAYSTEIGAAWKVAEKVALTPGCGHSPDSGFTLRYAPFGDHREFSRDSPCDLDAPHHPSGAGSWSAHFHFGYANQGFGKFCAMGETAPLAICRAALKVYR